MIADSVDVVELPERIDPTIVPVWLTTKYDGMEKDIESWLFSYYFWRKWDGKNVTKESVMIQARAAATARYEALMQTEILKGATDRSIMYQLATAKRTSWFKYFGEIQDVYELLDHMLRDAIEMSPTGGRRYELEFLIDTLLPTLEKMNIPMDLIIGIPQNIAKAQRSASIMKRIIQENGEQAGARLTEVLVDISDPNISFSDFTKRNAERVGKKQLSVLQGRIYFTLDKEIIVIESDRAHTQTLQRALKGLVEEFSVSDGVALINYMSREIMPSVAMLRNYVIDIENDEICFIQKDNGVLLPEPSRFNTMTLEELARSHDLIEQLIEVNGHAVVPVYTFPIDPNRSVAKQLYISDTLVNEYENDVDIIREAVVNTYVIDNSISRVLESDVVLMPSLLIKKSRFELCVLAVKKGANNGREDKDLSGEIQG